VQGFKILAQPKGIVKHRKPAPVDNREQRLALLASPCTQMGLTNLRAFNMFCKETRPKRNDQTALIFPKVNSTLGFAVLKENKNLGLCEVAPLLARMWKELPAEEKLHFEEQAEEYKINKLKNNNSLLAR
jgi:HMG-box domain